jgi:hypothetical protein
MKAELQPQFPAELLGVRQIPYRHGRSHDAPGGGVCGGGS